eukprot:358192-Chlamydomonas_euryale.AAC.9
MRMPGRRERTVFVASSCGQPDTEVHARFTCPQGDTARAAFGSGSAPRQLLCTAPAGHAAAGCATEEPVVLARAFVTQRWTRPGNPPAATANVSMGEQTTEMCNEADRTEKCAEQDTETMEKPGCRFQSGHDVDCEVDAFFANLSSQDFEIYRQDASNFSFNSELSASMNSSMFLWRQLQRGRAPSTC